MSAWSIHEPRTAAKHLLDAREQVWRRPVPLRRRCAARQPRAAAACWGWLRATCRSPAGTCCHRQPADAQSRQWQGRWHRAGRPRPGPDARRRQIPCARIPAANRAASTRRRASRSRRSASRRVSTWRRPTRSTTCDDFRTVERAGHPPARRVCAISCGSSRTCWRRSPEEWAGALDRTGGRRRVRVPEHVPPQPALLRQPGREAGLRAEPRSRPAGPENRGLRRTGGAYYRLEDQAANVWIAHQRYPTKGRVWHPGGAHPSSA